MSTVKRKASGAIVLNDGKVSCTCCNGCCMYPSQELYDEYYSPNDLPDEIDVDGVSYARAGTSYGDTTNGVLLEVNVWARYKNSVRLTQPCLIEKGVKDKFADTYTVTDANGSSVILRRVGECTWLSDLRESFCRTVEQGFWKESYEFPPWKVMYSLQGWRPFVPYNNGGEVAFWQLFKFNVVPYGNDFVVNPIIGYTPETQSPIYGDNADEIVGYETIPPQPIYGESGWTSIIWECNFAYQDNHIYKSSPGNSPVGEYHFVGSDGIRYLYNTIT